MTEQTRKRIIIEPPSEMVILAARHLDLTEGRVQVGAIVDKATRSAITAVLDYIATAHNSPTAATRDEDTTGQPEPEDERPIEITNRALKTAIIEATERAEQAEHRLRLAHQTRRAKEHQLDGIRRALCDIGFMQDDDPYTHADLEDVIRQNTADPAVTEAADTSGWLFGGSRDLSIPDQHRFTARPVTPEMERAATERARQAAADSEKAAEWIAGHSSPHPAEAVLRAADFTAAHWHQWAIDSSNIPAAHAIACIRAALKGHTDPGQLGLDDDAHDAFRAALAQPKEQP